MIKIDIKKITPQLKFFVMSEQIERPHKICPSTMRTNRDKNLILNNANVHNYAPNPEDLSKRRIISDVRIRARTTTKSPRRLLADCLSRSIPSVSPLIPSYNSLQRNVQMIRQRINLPPTIPSDAAHLIIPEQYKINGLENDGERFILFATPRQLNILSRCSNSYFDSTFNSVPEIFYHLFVIQGEYNNVLIPCVFPLM
ncbi:hypothetical protein HZS_4059 [Henneguya salminicola]|nr:hypothetical protein HZS_4059 [Henneguya salminicola]